MRRIIFLVAAFVCVLALLVGSGSSASSAGGPPGGKRGERPQSGTVEAPQARPEGGTTLVLDDGSAEAVLGWGSDEESFGAIWLNRFSVASMRYPVTVDSALIAFPAADLGGEINFVGKTIRVVVYVDPNSDGDPTDAINVFANSQVIQVVEQFQDFPIGAQINQPGDLYIGWEDQWADNGHSPFGYPALLDTDSSRRLSFVAANIDSTTPNISNLGANQYISLITEQEFGYEGNLLVRASVREYVPEPPRCPGERFTDVCPGDYYYTPVLNLNDRGVISGYSSSPPCDTPSHAPCFLPNRNLTRGQGAKIVALAAGVPAASGGQRFQDVAPGSPFYNEINALAALGHMGGYPCGGAGEPCGGGNLPYFRPGANVTRGQLSKIVSNTAGYTEPHSSQSFEDVPTSGAFYIWIQRLSSRGIINGYTCGGPGEPCRTGNRSYFRPNAEITRAQTAKIVYGVWPEATEPAK